MSWWSRLWRRSGRAEALKGAIHCVRLTLPGWIEVVRSDDRMRVWEDCSRSVLSLAAFNSPNFSEEAAMRQWCRAAAQDRDAGLIEANTLAVQGKPGFSLIYKRLQTPGYIFTGQLFILLNGESFVWTVVAGERGTTGLREAVVTAELLNAGKLTDCDRQWAEDPYDPAYRGVDRSVLRFISDDQCYDERFPDHPLSRVRRVLALLPNHIEHVEFNSNISQSSDSKLPMLGTSSSQPASFTSRMPFQSVPGHPYYTVLERNRLGKNRRDFSDLEDSSEIARLRTKFESELLSPPRLPAEDKPLLTSLLSGPSGVFTVTLPNSTPCLLTFSTPLRASEYARINAGALQLRYLSSSPQEFVRMLGDLMRCGALQSFALDVCPHCMTFPVLNIGSILTPADVVKIWAIHKSGELARESLYFARANEAVACGNFQEAEETVLEAIQHVTMESPRLHLLLGEIALYLGEKEVFCEARTFLEFLQAEQPLRELLAAEQSSKIQN